MFSQNFSIIRAVARELHLPKIKGVEANFFSNMVKTAFSFEA
jgi:hypothetical protein